jgi:KTSC domain
MDRAKKSRLFWLALIIAGVGIAATKIRSEVVQVKYRGEVSLASFDCTSGDRSSVVKRVCYDRGNQYMLINLSGTYYHYCEIDNGTVTALISAESIGRFYNSAIKGRFDCRTHRIPDY